MAYALYQSLWMLAQVFANLADDGFFSEMQWYFQQQVLFAATSQLQLVFIQRPDLSHCHLLIKQPNATLVPPLVKRNGINIAGEQAGIELDLMARSTDGQILTLQQGRIRMGIAVSRYLKQSRDLIWNAAEGIFPSTKPLPK